MVKLIKPEGIGGPVQPYVVFVPKPGQGGRVPRHHVPTAVIARFTEEEKGPPS